MTRPSDGGPAFPLALHTYGAGEHTGTTHLPGLSLRDYFAAQAMVSSWRVNEVAAYLRDPNDHNLPYRISSVEACYIIADAMLAERAKGGAA